MGRAPDAKGGATRLVSVKAVSDAYPLRGKLRLRARRRREAGRGRARRRRPGTVWVDAAVLDSLGLQVGDPLLLGDATLDRRQRHRASSPTAAPASPASRRA